MNILQTFFFGLWCTFSFLLCAWAANASGKSWSISYSANSVSKRYNLNLIYHCLFSRFFFSDHSGYLIPLEVTGSADCHPDGAILSELQSPKPPQDKPKDKTYDYAKPEGIIMLTASRSSLDSLDSHRQADVPSSPKNTTFQGPYSPRSPGASSKEPSHDKEGDDSLQADDYIEVLPN